MLPIGFGIVVGVVIASISDPPLWQQLLTGALFGAFCAGCLEVLLRRIG